MADPLDQKIIAGIVARLALINGTGGYNTTIASGKIADSRPNWDQEDDLPALSVFQGTTKSAEWPQGRRKTQHTMPVLIKGFLKRGTDASNARKLIADIKKAIRGASTEANRWLDERWPAVSGTSPGLALATREGSHSIEYAEGTFEITGVQVEIEVDYLTDKFNAEEST
jgi:hypothetical protein